jgi:hypothetical protein
MIAELDPNNAAPFWKVEEAAALIAAIDVDLGKREAANAELEKKGRLDPREAEYVGKLIRDIRDDLLFCFSPLKPGEARAFQRPDPLVEWSAKVRWLKGELERRERDYPEWERKGRMTPQEREAGIRLMTELGTECFNGGRPRDRLATISSRCGR